MTHGETMESYTIEDIPGNLHKLDRISSSLIPIVLEAYEIATDHR